ncbi:unnamed protein product [Callosobruchus maculatus]|uniref:Uncharacterized protein n=1 Tax=Callosobruchus maculatus TaxID=64391 RepID=A0A653CVQ5_CALMS|nr:unnamed protein product [Callosobruchus maculatus]
MEGIQRRFLKYLTFKKDEIYPRRGCDHLAMLVRFEMQPLELRRINNSLKFLFKLVRNQTDSPALLSKVDFHVPVRISRRDPTFYLSAPKSKVKWSIHFMCANFNLISDCCDLHHDSIRDLQSKFSENHFSELNA